MLVVSLPQYVQGLTSAKIDLTGTSQVTLYTAPSNADSNASVINSLLVVNDSGSASTITRFFWRSNKSRVYFISNTNNKCKYYNRIVNK